MRPVNKGFPPYISIDKYSESLPYLEERIGLYCSYCEAKIGHVPEVEHKISKSKGGDWTEWGNLLLSCKYCNTRKSNQITPDNKDEYLWPDEHNTALAYSYAGGIPKVNSDVILSLDHGKEIERKAKNLFDLVKLGKDPRSRGKDRRFRLRNEAFDSAQHSLENWNEMKGTDRKNLRDQIIRTAKGLGFFSVWMEVFEKEPEIKNALIDAFPGTEKTFFDSDGNVKKIFVLNPESPEAGKEGCPA